MLLAGNLYDCIAEWIPTVQEVSLRSCEQVHRSLRICSPARWSVSPAEGGQVSYFATEDRDEKKSRACCPDTRSVGSEVRLFPVMSLWVIFPL